MRTDFTLRAHERAIMVPMMGCSFIRPSGSRRGACSPSKPRRWMTMCTACRLRHPTSWTCRLSPLRPLGLLPSRMRTVSTSLPFVRGRALPARTTRASSLASLASPLCCGLSSSRLHRMGQKARVAEGTVGPGGEGHMISPQADLSKCRTVCELCESPATLLNARLRRVRRPDTLGDRS